MRTASTGTAANLHNRSSGEIGVARNLIVESFRHTIGYVNTILDPQLDRVGQIAQVHERHDVVGEEIATVGAVERIPQRSTDQP